MVNISKQTEDSIKFVFENSQHYLIGNGEISVPLNSLQLVIDSSDMVTFKKLDGDPFVSFNIDESNFASKDALVEFYETEMVGGGGIPTEEIQEMIDDSIAPIKAETVTDAEYISSAHTINLYNISGTVLSSIDATDFIKDGMVNNVEVKDVEISGETIPCLAITFNTDAGHQEIDIPLSEFFDSTQYYTKSETDALLSGKANSSDVYTRTVSNYRYMSGASITSGASYDRLYMNKGDGMTNTVAAYFGKINGLPIATKNSSAVNNFTLTEESAFTAFSASTEAALSGKQDTLIAGSGITISGNVISADGGSITIDPSLDSGSTNAVANSAITTAINSKQNAIDYFVITGYSPTVSTGSSSGINYTELTIDRRSPKTGARNTGKYYLPFINGKSIFRDMNARPLYDEFNLVETSAITSSITSASTDSEIPTAKAVFDAVGQGGGGLDEDFLQANANALYELKQEGKATNEKFDSYYTKTASDGRYASNASIKKAYYDKAYVDDKLLAISASLNELNDDKQETLVAGSGISISGNVISAEGGGGAEYSAGTNIDISGNVISTKNVYYGTQWNGTVNPTKIVELRLKKRERVDLWDSSWYDSLYIYLGNNLYFQGSAFNVSGVVETSAVTTTISSGSTDSEIPTAKAVFDAVGQGGGGLSEDTEKLIASALVDLNETKADISDIKANYQRKGDYATKTELAAKANVSDVMTLEKAKENELVTAKALNSINERLIALEAAIQAIQQSNQNN